MKNEQINLIKIVRSRFLEMQTRNPSYSVRAYAKRLGMGASTLSMVLSGQRQCSKKVAAQIADRLMLDPLDRASVLEKTDLKNKKQTSEHVLSYLKVSNDQFVAFSEWSYMAILNLVRMKSFKNDPSWIAGRVGITEKQVVEALDRLQRLGMLITDENGKLKRSHEAYRTSDDIADVTIRKGHFQTLDLAKKSLEEDEIDIRDFSWLTMSVKQSQMKEMKEFIRKFQTEFVELFAKNEDPDEVYRLAVQMIPLTKKIETNKKIKRK